MRSWGGLGEGSACALSPDVGRERRDQLGGRPSAELRPQLIKAELLVCDELDYLPFMRAGAELPFPVFADRYQRASLLVTSNLPFSEWNQPFQGERMTAAQRCARNESMAWIGAI